jgi:hypothetical protein
VLANPAGARLQLVPSSAEGRRPQTGAVKNTTARPLIGLDRDAAGVQLGYLVTNLDRQDFATHLPMLYTVTPVRVLDTRTARGRAGIVASSPDAIDPEGRPAAGAWIDVAVDVATAGLDAFSVYANLVVMNAVADGELRVWGFGEPEPATFSVCYQAGRTVANFALVAVGETGGRSCGSRRPHRHRWRWT